jgi:hypothetical protein
MEGRGGLPSVIAWHALRVGKWPGGIPPSFPGYAKHEDLSRARGRGIQKEKKDRGRRSRNRGRTFQAIKPSLFSLSSG